MGSLLSKTFASERQQKKIGFLSGNGAERQVHNIEINRIYSNPSQPRRVFNDEAIVRLADSIRQYGFIQPLTVRRADGSFGDDIVFELVAGERRLRAARLLNLTSVPCVTVDVDARRSAEMSIIENLTREELNMFEQASAIASLIDGYGMTQDKIARKISSGQSAVANKLRLLRLTLKEREMILGNSLSERHARAFLRISDVELRDRVMEQVIARGLNVQKTEEYIERLLDGGNEPEEDVREKRKFIIKDMKIFYNTIDRAVDIMKSAGVDVKTEIVETDDVTEMKILIPKSVRIAT